MLERLEGGCVIGTGKGKWANNRLVPEERLEEIDAKQDKCEEGKRQPDRPGNQQHPALQADIGSCGLYAHLFHLFLAQCIRKLDYATHEIFQREEKLNY
jgi:hypothetical protein